MDVLELTRALWRKKWLIVAAVVITAAVTLVLLRYKQEKYQSVARISTGFTVENKADLTEKQINSRQVDMKFSNLLALMNSSLSFNLLSYRLLLHDLDSVESRFRSPAVSSGPVEDVFEDEEQRIREGELFSKRNVAEVKAALRRRLDNLTPLNSDDPDYVLIDRFYGAFNYGFKEVRESTVIQRLPNTDFIQVEYTSEDSKLSAFAANAFCKGFMRYYNSLRNESSGESVAFLETQIKQKKEELDEKIEVLRTFKEDNNIVTVDGEEGSRMSQLVALENQRDEISSTLHGIDLTVDRLKGDLSGISSGEGPNNNSQIVTLQQRIDDVNDRYIAGGSSSRELADSLNAMRTELRHLLAGIGSTGTGLSATEVRSKLRDAQIEQAVQQRLLNSINAKISDLNRKIFGYSSKETKIASLQREIDLVSQEHLDLVNRYNLAKGDQAASNNLKIALPATPPVSSVSIQDIYILILACMGSAGLVMFGIILMEVVDSSIKTPSRFGRVFKIPFLGVINKVNTKRFNIAKQFSDRPGSESSTINSSLLRQVRHEIEALNSKIFLFTSLKPREGKSFAIFCMAYVLSLLNKKVLVIDTNFRNNSLTQIYGQGLKEIKVIQKMIPSKLLSESTQTNGKTPEDVPPAGTPNRLVNPTKFKNVFFVGNIGVFNRSPSEILSSKDFESFLSLMEENYDYILLEGASLNANSDTKELVKYADKVVNVVSANSEIEPIDKVSMHYLKTLNGKLAGGILNNVKQDDLKL